jgi:hypothetical protein
VGIPFGVENIHRLSVITLSRKILGDPVVAY